MNDACYFIPLELHKAQTGISLTAKKGDTGRTLRFYLTDNGAAYTMGADCYAIFTATKPDGNIIFNPCQISGNVVSYTFTPQTCAVCGELACEVKIYGGDDKLITAPGFTLVVEDTVYCDEDVVESEKEVSALTDLVSRTAALWADVEQKLADNAFADAHSAVCYTAQSLLDTQKTQARKNIAAFPDFLRVLTAEDDMDAVTDNGIYVYATASIPANAPFSNAAVVMVFGNASGTTQKIQFAFRYGAAGQGKFRALYGGSWFPWAEFAGYLADETYPDCYYRYTNGVKEWVNPPMVPGVEYRTTERREGKVVYTKYVELGNLPSSGVMTTVYCSSGATSVEFQAFRRSSSGWAIAPFPYINNSGTICATVNATQYSLIVAAQSDVSTSTAFAIVKYTKD